MEDKGLYIILFKGLSLGEHIFEWTIDSGFFAMYEMSEISDASVSVQLTMTKHNRFLELNFVMDGWVEVSCDRCLDPLKLNMASEAQMIVRFGEHHSDDDTDNDDVIVLSQGEDRLNVAQYLYEFAHLNLPLRRVHPDDANGQSSCNADMLRKLNEYLIEK